MNEFKNRGAGFFIIGIALFTIGLATENRAFWIIGLVFVAFALLSARIAGK